MPTGLTVLQHRVECLLDDEVVVQHNQPKADWKDVVRALRSQESPDLFQRFGVRELLPFRRRRFASRCRGYRQV